MPSGGGEKKYTGSYDVEGLKTIGYTDEEIAFYNENGVTWDEEYNDGYKLIASELAGNTTSTTRFIPKTKTSGSFTNYYNLLTIPDNFSISSPSSAFSGCYSLKTIPNIRITGTSTTATGMFKNCWTLQTFSKFDTSKFKSFTQFFNIAIHYNQFLN